MIPFTKMHGAGNDYVYLDGFSNPIPDDLPAMARHMSDRHKGIGSDGLIVIAPCDSADAEMIMFNADGSRAEMCGNGIRVFVHYLLDRRLAEIAPGHSIAIGTRAGVRDVHRLADGYAADLGRWRLDGSEPLVKARELPVARPGLGIEIGNPHVVVALASDEELDSLDLSAPPTLDPAPPAGANVEFVVPADPLVVDGVGRIRLRVHERGSGETLSCGTGAAAAALAVRHWAGAAAPNEWRVTVPGGVLGVRMFAAEDGEHVALSGPAVLVYDGELLA